MREIDLFTSNNGILFPKRVTRIRVRILRGNLLHFESLGALNVDSLGVLHFKSLGVLHVESLGVLHF